MELKFLGLRIEIGKATNKTETEESELNKLSSIGSTSKITQSRMKIKKAYLKMLEDGVKYSEYKLQKYSGLSINTIKKHRDFIESLREDEQGLFE